jgi:hypothetical protein
MRPFLMDGSAAMDVLNGAVGGGFAWRTIILHESAQYPSQALTSPRLTLFVPSAHFLLS